jgi:hypothetical protein
MYQGQIKKGGKDRGVVRKRERRKKDSLTSTYLWGKSPKMSSICSATWEEVVEEEGEFSTPPATAWLSSPAAIP